MKIRTFWVAALGAALSLSLAACHPKNAIKPGANTGAEVGAAASSGAGTDTTNGTGVANAGSVGTGEGNGASAARTQTAGCLRRGVEAQETPELHGGRLAVEDSIVNQL